MGLIPKRRTNHHRLDLWPSADHFHRHEAMSTPDFVAPEALVAGMPVDGRADL